MRHLVTVLAASLASVVLVYGCSSSSNSASPGGDGGTLDASKRRDARGPYDSSQSGGDDSSIQCPTPDDVSKWKPPAYVPAKHSPTACTQQQLTDFDTACLGSGSSTAACNAFQSAQATCYACLVTKSLQDPTWGPLYVDNGTYEANLGGCIELAAPGNTTCQEAEQAAELCVHAACDGPCPVSSQATFNAYESCATTADTEGCSSYLTASNCAASITGPGAACNGQLYSTFDGLFLAIAPFFCSGTDDGGALEGGTEGGATEAGAESGAGDAASD